MIANIRKNLMTGLGIPLNTNTTPIKVVAASHQPNLPVIEETPKVKEEEKV